MKQIAFGFFHQNIDNGIVSYAIWHVMPIPVLVCAAIGLYMLAKKRSYIPLVPLGVGAAYWIAYAFVSPVFVIEYPRIVVIAALLLIVPAGMGIEWLLQRLPRGKTSASWLKGFLLVCAAGAFIYTAWIYPGKDARTHFVLHQNGNDLIPSPPVNRYITPDDLKLFSGIRGAAFIAPPWKALAVAVATENYPMETKPATIGADILPYAMFMAADCASKTTLAEKYAIRYVYSDAFSCAGFSEIGRSSERLHLYRYAKITP